MRRFHDSNPAAVALYYLCVTGVTMFSVNPVIISISLLASVLNYCLYAEGGVKPHVFSAVLLMIFPIRRTASMSIPVIVEPTFTDEHTSSVSDRAIGMDSSRSLSAGVMPLDTSAL